jgi:regulator of replication initiation timing
MSQEFQALSTSVEHLLAEHTRLRVENQALTQRLRALEEKLATNGQRVKQAQARLNALVAQLPLESPPSATPPAVSQPSLI